MQKVLSLLTSHINVSQLVSHPSLPSYPVFHPTKSANIQRPNLGSSQGSSWLPAFNLTPNNTHPSAPPLSPSSTSLPYLPELTHSHTSQSLFSSRHPFFQLRCYLTKRSSHTRPSGFFSCILLQSLPCASLTPPLILQASAAVHVADPLSPPTRPLMLATSRTAMLPY
ncbi:hypothetical protein LZ32DRAFT_336739 [Colletotrichum eremochloae]|nr:hypothetical protein LZ32DRAFT_336739 [Colletotrichum eremochloae]